MGANAWDPYTEGVDNAVWRGLFDCHATTPLQLAERLDRFTWVEG